MAESPLCDQSRRPSANAAVGFCKKQEGGVSESLLKRLAFHNSHSAALTCGWAQGHWTWSNLRRLGTYSLTVFFDRNSVTATLHIYAMNGIAFLSKHKTEYHLTLLDALNSPQVKPQIPEPGAGMRNLLTEMGNGYR